MIAFERYEKERLSEFWGEGDGSVRDMRKRDLFFIFYFIVFLVFFFLEVSGFFFFNLVER